MSNKKNGKHIPCENCGKLIYYSKKRLESQKHFYCSNICCKKLNIPWNKGLTKKNDNRLKLISEKSKKQMFREYNTGTRNKNEIVKKAHEAIRKKSMDKFNNNPTKYISKRGYWMIYIPNKGWVKEHHYVWEQVNGKIQKGNVIHHINFDKLDNRIENLMIFTNNAEHVKFHFAKKIIDKYGKFIPKELT